MGFGLDSLGKLLDPGAMAHQLVDSFLPKDMQWVGGLVGAAVDYECGNVPGAISQGMSALSDLKDTPQSSAPNMASNGPNAGRSIGGNQSWSYEPSPPPFRTTTVTTTTTTTSSSTSTNQTPSTKGPVAQFRAAVDQLKQNASQSTTIKSPSSEGWFAQFRATVDQLKQNASQSTTTTTTTTTTTISSIPPGTIAGTANPTSNPNPVPSETSKGAPPAAPASSPSASNATGSTPSSTSDGVKTLLAMSNDDLQRAIASGNVPKDLSNSDMLALQTRMNQISQMNQLMTQMISAMHDMRMAVARNIHA